MYFFRLVTADLTIYHQSGNNIIASDNWTILLRQNLDDDIIFQSDNGSGGGADHT